jgi:hypothetical protein
MTRTQNNHEMPFWAKIFTFICMLIFAGFVMFSSASEEQKEREEYKKLENSLNQIEKTEPLEQVDPNEKLFGVGINKISILQYTNGDISVEIFEFIDPKNGKRHLMFLKGNQLIVTNADAQQLSISEINTEPQTVEKK